MSLLSADLTISYRNSAPVLDGVRFAIDSGEIFGLVGPSGSGKSTTALAILHLLDDRDVKITGSLAFEGRDLLRCREREFRRLRGRKIALVPQSPTSALNPVLRLESHFREAWCAHSPIGWREGRIHALHLLSRMDLPATDEFLRRYPHQISVGQAQRVLIAMAVLHGPALLIADEPTSALDPAAHAGILDLFRRLNREFGMAILFISHDLDSVAALCHRAAILEQGRLSPYPIVRSAGGGLLPIPLPG